MQGKTINSRRVFLTRILTGLLCVGLLSPLWISTNPAAAASSNLTSNLAGNLASSLAAATGSAAAGIQVADAPGGVSFDWTRTHEWHTGGGAHTWPAAFDTQLASDALLPVHTFTVWPRTQDAPDAPLEALVQLQVLELSVSPFTGQLPPAPSMEPNALGYTRPAYVEPWVAPPAPTTPLTVLRKATSRGRVEIVIAFSPIFQDAASGQLVQVDRIRAEVGNAVLPAPDAGELQTAATAGTYALQAVPPTNPLARRSAWKITVANGGMQVLTAAALADAGLENPAANRLALYHNGEEIALHILDANSNGRVDGSNEAIRFYAPPPGDLWNRTDTYWLTETDSGNRVRMATAAPTAQDAPIRNSAYAQGVWREPKDYNSNIPGPAGDYWFHLEAVARSGVPSEERRFTAPIAPDLPLATVDDLDATLQVHGTLLRQSGSNFTNADHLLRYTAQNGSQQEVTYTFGEGGSTLDTTFGVTLTAPTPEVTVTFLVGERPLGILFDSVEWQQPVELNFRSGGENRGARFTGLAGSWRYRLRNLPNNAVVYAVTEAARPRIMPLSDANDGKLLGAGSGDAQEGAQYIVAGPGTLYTPSITPNPPVDLRSGAADAIYIAPADLHSTLEPLVQQREAQGYAVAVVDIQAIYDNWSFGQVAPDAIRNFLRHAASTWEPAPISVVLVGDGSHDPHSYLGNNNPNLIPPYLAHVDPHNGQTACDNCYGQLDGDHPLSEESFAMDIYVGRFPVINTTELRSVVNKILRYENATDTNADWRSTSLQIADDYFQPNGSPDPAGDFVASAELINALKPETIKILRHYFNVELSEVQLAQLDSEFRALYESYAQWFTTDPDDAWRETIRLMNEGAGLVTYTGHANHWKWAETTDDSESGHLFGLNDVNSLNNFDELFINLSMTCYTSLFSEPAPAHFTLDERVFLRPSGGSVASWGPSGLSIVYAHDMLQQGFHETLWSGTPMTVHLGAAVEGGYAQIRTQSCCQDVLTTFLILGDPLMPVRVNQSSYQYLPTVQSAD